MPQVFNGVFSVNSGDIVVSALLDILAVEMDDKAGYIAWWLYDDVDKTVSWEENGSGSPLTLRQLMYCTISSWRNTIKGSDCL